MSATAIESATQRFTIKAKGTVHLWGIPCRLLNDAEIEVNDPTGTLHDRIARHLEESEPGYQPKARVGSPAENDQLRQELADARKQAAETHKLILELKAAQAAAAPKK